MPATQPDYRNRPPRPASATDTIEQLITLLSRLPGLGPRSARRAALHLIEHRATLLEPLATALTRAADTVTQCQRCGNFTTQQLCHICVDPDRSDDVICVVEGVADLWAMERSNAFRGRYHVLGGTLTAVGNVRPEDLRIPELQARAANGSGEVILALNATFDGQTTAHYIAESLTEHNVRVTQMGYGLPVGGELDYLDPDTISAALQGRRNAL